MPRSRSLRSAVRASVAPQPPSEISTGKGIPFTQVAQRLSPFKRPARSWTDSWEPDCRESTRDFPSYADSQLSIEILVERGHPLTQAVQRLSPFKRPVRSWTDAWEPERWESTPRDALLESEAHFAIAGAHSPSRRRATADKQIIFAEDNYALSASDTDEEDSEYSV